MQTLSLLFTQSNEPFGVVSRWLKGSKWSHVGIVIGDQILSVSFGKVHKVPLEKFFMDVGHWEMGTLQCFNTDAVIQAAQEQVGQRGWSSPGLVAWAMEQAGNPLGLTCLPTPEDLYAMCSSSLVNNHPPQ